LNIEPNNENVISVSQIGTIVAQIRNQKWYASQNIFCLSQKSTYQNLISIFTVSVINKSLGESFSDGYGNYPTLDTLKNLKVKLPTKNGEIDFEFMESFMAELESERMADLDSYLVATGLKDYTLTDEEKQVLEDFEKREFTAFNVVDVFDIKNSGNILSRDIVENSGATPYLGAGAENNSVSSYISYHENLLEKGNCIFIGGKTFVITYQEKDFYSNDSHNLVLHLKNEDQKSKQKQLFLVTCINKCLGHKYSWGDSISNKKIQTDKITLPTQNNQPDYAMMDTLIRAIQKLVIKDVVLYVDGKIAGVEIQNK
jgi:Type I restriction modification DNA specificity domain